METQNACRCGVIGVGLLGFSIARRLLSAGYEVIGYDVDERRCQELAARGGLLGKSATDVVERSEFTLLSLPDSSVVRAVMDELRPSLKHGVDLLDTTTGAPGESERMASELSQIGGRWIDTTVVGSSQQMLDGQAILLVGGDESAYRDYQDLFSTLGARSFHVGPSGSAARMKLVVNLVIGLHRAVMAEGLTFAASMGFDLPTTLEIFRNSAAYSRMMDTKGEKMIREDFEPQARLAQHLKDVDLILDASAEENLGLPLSSVHRELLQRVVERGCGDLDNSAIIKAYQPGDKH